MDIERVMITLAIYPRLDEPSHFDIQSTVQTYCVTIYLAIAML